MSGAYLERAVEALIDHLRGNLADELGNYEWEWGLSSGSIPRPVAFVAHRADFDNRSPLICAFDDGARFADDRPFILQTRVPVLLSYEGDAQIAAGELVARRYCAAIIDCVRRDPTLGGEVANTQPLEVASARLDGDRSMTRYVWAVIFNVTTYRRIETT